MNPTYFGAEQVTEEDRSYQGSRFSEVRDALFANPYRQRKKPGRAEWRHTTQHAEQVHAVDGQRRLLDAEHKSARAGADRAPVFSTHLPFAVRESSAGRKLLPQSQVMVQ